MRKVALQVLILIVVSLGFSLIIGHSVAAADTIYYFKLDTAYRDLSDSGFDNRLFQFAKNPSAFALVPEIDDSIGYGFTFGGVRGHIGGELYFRYSEHDDDLGNNDLTFYELGGNFKYYFIEYGKTAFNFYALAGMAYTRMESDKAGVSGTYYPATKTLDIDNMGGAYYKGKVYNLGLGTTWQFADHFGLEAQYIYGFYHTMSLHAYGEQGNRFDDVDGSIQTLSLGVDYIF